MENKQDSWTILIVMCVFVAALYIMLYAAIGVFLYAIGYQIYFIARYERGENRARYFMLFTGLFFIIAWLSSLSDFDYYGRSQDGRYLTVGILKICCTAIPIGLHYLYRLLEPISPAVISVIDTAHLYYKAQKITKNERDKLIQFAKNSPVEIVERFVINGFTHETKNSENSYSDFDGAERQASSSQSQTYNTKPDDEFSYDGSRFSDERFSTGRQKKSYQSSYRAAYDPATPEAEALLHLKKVRRADAGKTKGVKALPKPPDLLDSP